MYRSKLEQIVEETGIKKKWLAEKAEISPHTLSYLIKGESEPTLKTARKIAKALNMTIEELFPEEEESQPTE